MAATRLFFNDATFGESSNQFGNPTLKSIAPYGRADSWNARNRSDDDKNQGFLVGLPRFFSFIIALRIVINFRMVPLSRWVGATPTSRAIFARFKP